MVSILRKKGKKLGVKFFARWSPPFYRQKDAF
jgi:hypothetical protein